ncbi:uncharacterized protein LOC135379062 [Ornithodoros turicata]|uniref:uncharacterized protein LOC135379062 n=1 Tax=Ornithodoros turicata TaxID=34597 RepID=UPI003139E007
MKDVCILNNRNRSIPVLGASLMPREIAKTWRKMSLEWFNSRAFLCGKVAPLDQPDMDQEMSARHACVRREMHTAIELKNLNSAEQCLYSAPQLTWWLCPDTHQSALHRAVKRNAFDIYALLLACNCRFLNDAEKSCLDRLSVVQRCEIQRQTSFIDDYFSQHIAFLNSKLHGVSESFKCRMNDLFVKLDSISLVRTILKVLATTEHLIVDCNEERNSVEFMLPTAVRMDDGTIYLDGKEEEVLGLLARALCSLALHLVFNNGGKPYGSYGVFAESHYQESVECLMENRAISDSILRAALSHDSKTDLITGVPQVLAYYNDAGKGDTLLKQEAGELYRFFKYHVVSSMEVYIEETMLEREAEEIRTSNEKLGRRWDECVPKKFANSYMYHNLPHACLSVLTAPTLLFLEELVDNAFYCVHRFLFLEARRWDSVSRKVLSENRCVIVTISCGGMCDIQEILEVLHEVKEVQGAKIILLVETQNIEYYVAQVKGNAFFEKKHAVQEVDRARFENVSRYWATDVLKEMRVRLLSSEASFSCDVVFNMSGSVDLLDEATFVKLCKKECLVIGQGHHGSSQEPVGSNHLDDLVETASPYSLPRITLKFERAVMIEMNTLFDVLYLDEALAICSLSSRESIASELPNGEDIYSMDELDEFRQFVFLKCAEQYDDLIRSSYYSDRIVHLLEFDLLKRRFLWRKSNGPSSHLPISDKYTYDVRCALNTKEKIVVVCGTPGMGKTTIARQLAKEVKAENGKIWVLYIDLPNQERLGNLRDPVETFRKFAALCGVKDDGIEYSVFWELISSTSPVKTCIAFDGYDAITEGAREVTLILVRCLAEETSLKLFVFSRTVFKDSLQDALHTVPYELAPIEAQDSEMFFKKCGRNKSSRSVLSKVAEIYRNGSNLAELQSPMALRIIAELLCADDAEDRSQFVQDIFRRSDDVTLLDLLKLYIETKYMAYRKQKEEAGDHAGTVSHDGGASKHEFHEVYGLLALRAIFNEDMCARILNQTRLGSTSPDVQLRKDAAEFVRGHGIVVSINDGVPVFAQRTLAELFAAEFLSQRVSQSRTKNAPLSYILSTLSADDAYSGVLKFFKGLEEASNSMDWAAVEDSDDDLDIDFDIDIDDYSD